MGDKPNRPSWPGGVARQPAGWRAGVVGQAQETFWGFDPPPRLLPPARWLWVASSWFAVGPKVLATYPYVRVFPSFSQRTSSLRSLTQRKAKSSVVSDSQPMRNETRDAGKAIPGKGAPQLKPLTTLRDPTGGP